MGLPFRPPSRKPASAAHFPEIRPDGPTRNPSHRNMESTASRSCPPPVTAGVVYGEEDENTVLNDAMKRGWNRRRCEPPLPKRIGTKPLFSSFLADAADKESNEANGNSMSDNNRKDDRQSNPNRPKQKSTASRSRYSVIGLIDT